jgi:hypothetical protein
MRDGSAHPAALVEFAPILAQDIVESKRDLWFSKGNSAADFGATLEADG